MTSLYKVLRLNFGQNCDIPRYSRSTARNFPHDNTTSQPAEESFEIISMQNEASASVSQKTRRAIRPCDSCRKRKSRCVINPPTGRCTVCELRGDVCNFREAVPKRNQVHPPVRTRNGASSSPRPGGFRAIMPEQASSLDSISPGRCVPRPLRDDYSMLTDL